MIEVDYDNFEIVFDFEKSGNPIRIYSAMSELLLSFQSLDESLGQVMGIEVYESMVLEDVQEGSIKTVIRNCINDLPDEDLRDANYKRIIGHFLVKAKYLILQWCQETTELANVEQVVVLEKKLIKLAESEPLTKIPAYREPDRVKLISSLSSIQKASKNLSSNDVVSYNCEHGTSVINKPLRISDTLLKDIIVKEEHEFKTDVILKVKKPDYLGTSKWIFKFRGQSIDVALSDQEWLADFQDKKVKVQPGDSIKGTLIQYISYGHNNEEVSVKYELTNIREILDQECIEQIPIDEIN